MILKFIPSFLYETQRFRVDVWMVTYHRIEIWRKRDAWKVLCDPKVPLSSLHETQRFQIGVWIWIFLESIPIIGSHKACKRMISGQLCGPRVHSIFLAQNPRALDGYSNKGSSSDFMNSQWIISNKARPLNLIIKFITSTRLWTLGFHEFESFQLIISFIGAQRNKRKQEMKEK